MSRVRKRLEQYKQELERQTQYKAGLPGSALDIVNTLLADLEEDEKENKNWIRRLRGSINGIRDIICNTDEIKTATCRVQEYMKNHGSDEEFIQNINHDFVLGFMISQRMMHNDFQIVWLEYLDSERGVDQWQEQENVIDVETCMKHTTQKTTKPKLMDLLQ